MEIKRIKKSESDLVIDLFNKYRVFYKQPSDLTLAQEFIQARLDNNQSIIFVAMEKNKPVGFTQLYPKCSSVRAVQNWILNDLYVEAEYRKKGIGEQLIHTVLDFAREEGSKFVELSTAADNFTAQGLYEKIGFKKQLPETEFFTYQINIF